MRTHKDGCEVKPQRNKPAPVDAEVPYSIRDIFFSRTDEKGRILFGNKVFQAISQYSWPEMSGQPHSIIRHPDMPRAVFWLLWDTIQKGGRIGAYVKNMAKDGRYYWVFAIVAPVEGGYLSVRIKPSGPFLQLIDREYAALAAFENTHRLAPAESAKKLLARLAELGFRDYETFMSAALNQEVKARHESLARAPDTAASLFKGLADEAAALLSQASGVMDDYTNHRYVPYNLRIRAAQFGQDGSAIGVVAMNYDILATSLKTMMADFIAAAERLFADVHNGLFLVNVAKIQGEAALQFQAESKNSATTNAGEIALLEKRRRFYEAEAAEGLRVILGDAQRFQEACSELKRAAAALETTRILGKVENARLPGADGGLDDLLGDLQAYQGAMSKGLQKMLAVSRSIERHADRLLRRAAA